MAKGLPGLAGSEHIGITVPDLETAKEFFIHIIGCELVFDGGASGRDPAFMQTSLSVHPDAELRYCFLRCGHGANFEVFEYSAPDQNLAPPKNSDIGGHHIAFYVDDIEAAVAHLKAHDVTVQGEINCITDGPAGGSAWVYFLAPWGLQLELVSYPSGKAYEASAAVRLWHPGFPGR
ncbi:MAG: VOC family protein [Aestuariivirgaceae bacterium]